MNNNILDIEKLCIIIGKSKIPINAFKEIISWNKIIKSPYGDSFYSDEVDWNYKSHNSYRISDHWNFTSGGKVHCSTVENIENKWALGIYDSKIGKYRILKTYNPTTKPLKENIFFRLFVLEIKYNKAISNVGVNDELSYSFLKKFYVILEKFGNSKIGYLNWKEIKHI